ncbi:hypothetical protein UQW22_05800 [Isoptericola halotolerans]|uniref:hypothetical protein n=1 Tax=Isoptericola halotolerans TaxID=300560 RepID=UPI0038908DA2
MDRAISRKTKRAAAVSLVVVGAAATTLAIVDDRSKASNGQEGASTSEERNDPDVVRQPGWELMYSESFNEPLPIDDEPWVIDPHGDKSPWHVDHLDDDGEFYAVQGGDDFERQLDAADVLRKRVAFGDHGWLTAELATRDYDKDGTPDGSASLNNVDVAGEPSGRLETGQGSGAIVRSTEDLPSEYRIEYTLKTLDFGGKRNGSWEYNGGTNGYSSEGCNTNWPWMRSGDFSGDAARCNSNFGDVRAENGYYFLAIMDYDDPAPHNNVFIHNHRKVGMDSYSVNGSWSSSYAACDPDSGETIPYDQTSANGINSIFFDGSRFRDPTMGYNEFIMPTECGVKDGSDSEATIVSAAEVQPELMPDATYEFAIERTSSGYTVEMAGDFAGVGPTKFRYHRNFVQDGKPIWHYNQTSDEYDGAFNSTLTFSGPFGSYSKEQWPEGSAYPDNFIIGDPHINYYEGSATIDDLRMYVPSAAVEEDEQ